MTAKINKALDFNKLLGDQAKGKLLKKHLSFPLFAGIKWDGNYTTVMKEAEGLITYVSSGGHIYDNDAPTVFDEYFVPSGMVYLAERIATTGEFGDRDNCALRGPRGGQTAYGHKYKVHDMMTIEEYEKGKSFKPYFKRRLEVREVFDKTQSWANDTPIHTREELEAYLDSVVARHFEGLMLKSPEWYWKDTKSRTVDNAKYKKRPTVDLLCIAVEQGEGKYIGQIGALTLKDSRGRIVSVGSGMTDEERMEDHRYFIGKVVEVFYERIGVNTYIQPTFGTDYAGVLIRYDKTAEDID